MTLNDSPAKRDHGGGLDAAMANWGGAREDWLDLSTGINPVPYPIGELPDYSWNGLPDKAAQSALNEAARQLWNVPDGVSVLAAPGASAIIARVPALAPIASVDIPEPTYNEHAAAFVAQGWKRSNADATARVLVHPNNPTGQFWTANDVSAPFNIIDESFCDIAPEKSLISQSAKQGCLILKSFGKFWGLAGLRLGFAIGRPELIDRLNDLTGPWAVSGPALHIGAKALGDSDWADATRARLTADSERLDRLMLTQGAKLAGGTPLFRLYEVDYAQQWQDRLASHHIWSRIFPYSTTYLRLGLPAPDRWAQLEAAL